MTASKAMNIIKRVTGGSSVQNSQRTSTEPSTGQTLSASMEIPIVASSLPAEPLTEDLKLEISTVFAKQLAKNIPLTRRVIYEKMARNTTLKDLTSCSSSKKTVSNYQSYQLRKNPDFPHPPSSTISTFTRVGNWESAIEKTASRTSVRMVWSAKDTGTITEHLKQFQLCPGKPTIEQLFDGSDELSNIMEKEKFSRSYEKVKNILKKRRREEQ